ncbi:MAG TPA: hypothetical protein VLA24_17915 [Pseudomonadales bacterium]|nr:hypothetical protein [Pseudomonadales bacterium]
MAVFWNTLDDHLVTLFTTEMGVGSAYSTMKVQTVNSYVFADAHIYSTWTLPAIVTAGWRITYNANEHMGSNGRIYRKKFQCFAYGIISGVMTTTTDTITDNLKEFYERMETAIAGDQFALGISERGRGGLIIDGEIDVVRYPSDDLDSTRRMGVARIVFEVESTKL